LPPHLQDVAAELRELSQKEHAEEDVTV